MLVNFFSLRFRFEIFHRTRLGRTVCFPPIYSREIRLWDGVSDLLLTSEVNMAGTKVETKPCWIEFVRGIQLYSVGTWSHEPLKTHIFLCSRTSDLCGSHWNPLDSSYKKHIVEFVLLQWYEISLMMPLELIVISATSASLFLDLLAHVTKIERKTNTHQNMWVAFDRHC